MELPKSKKPTPFGESYEGENVKNSKLGKNDTNPEGEQYAKSKTSYVGTLPAGKSVKPEGVVC